MTLIIDYKGGSNSSHLIFVACMPNMADWGILIMGVPNNDPNTPPLEIVKVPPVMSSRASAPSLAWVEQSSAERLISLFFNHISCCCSHIFFCYFVVCYLHKWRGDLGGANAERRNMSVMHCKGLWWFCHSRQEYRHVSRTTRKTPGTKKWKKVENEKRTCEE